MRVNVKHRAKTKRGRVVPINLTLPPLLYQKLDELVLRHGFSGPSDYFQARIRADAGLSLTNEQTPC